MRRVHSAGIVVQALVVATLAVVPSFAAGQATPQSAAPAAAPAQPALLTKDEVAAFAKVQIAVSTARDSMQARLAQPRNKTLQMQRTLRDSLVTQIAEIMHHGGMSEQEFQKKTYIVSTDPGSRKMFDSVVAKLTGVPIPGQLVAAGPVVAVPAGPVGVHIGHVVNMFNDVPGNQGLLSVALLEARTASQHATLGAQNPADLANMKLHAGHVIHALDPTIVAAGPGPGYGLKKAATGVATHIDLAAKAQGASPNVVTHANHIAASAKNTVVRSDSIIVLAKLVQAATAAPEAAKLMSQIISLANALTAGIDANNDGRVGWQDGEGGLQQADEHVKLMLQGEQKPPG